MKPTATAHLLSAETQNKVTETARKRTIHPLDGTKQELFMNKNIRQKLIIAAALMIAATASAFAQGNGLAGINEATSMVSSYFDPGV